MASSMGREAEKTFILAGGTTLMAGDLTLTLTIVSISSFNGSHQMSFLLNLILRICFNYLNGTRFVLTVTMCIPVGCNS
jgi:hypothetical protein